MKGVGGITSTEVTLTQHVSKMDLRRKNNLLSTTYM